MSFLTETQTKESTQGNPNTQNGNQPEWVQKIVQEKGDNWNNPEVIAKGYMDSQQYITELERQTKELREDLSKSEYAKELLEQLKQAPNSTAPSTPEPNGVTTTEPNTTTAVSETDLKSLIEETLTSREKEATASENLRNTEAELDRLFGTEKDKVLAERTAELNMSQDRLRALAAESPTAFLKLIGEAPNKQTNTTPQGTINTSAELLSQPSGQRNWSFYQKMRRENSKQYYSPKTQNQLLEDRKAQGEKFYS